MSKLQKIADKYKGCPLCRVHLKHLKEWDDKVSELQDENKKLLKLIRRCSKILWRAQDKLPEGYSTLIDMCCNLYYECKETI